jgi:hypothetical protein
VKKFVFEEFKTRKNKKGHPFGWPFDFPKEWRSSRGFGLRGFFCFRRRLFAFEVALPAFSIFNFVGLSAHKCLYFVRGLRFCKAHYETFGAAIQHLFGTGCPAGTGLRLPDRQT